jgi:hypothetical protein
MSETRLNFQQKLFAVVESMVKETEVRDIPMDVPAAVETLDYAFRVEDTVHPVEFNISAAIEAVDISMEPEIVEIVGELACPRIGDAAISDLETAVVDEKVGEIHCPGIFDVDSSLTTETKDFFEIFGVGKRLKYNTVVKSIEPGDLTPGFKRLNLTIFPILKDNLPFFNSITVEKRPVVLSFLSEEEQLEYWKKAVLKTRKDVKQLKMIGVYTGIPRGCIDNIKINFSTRCLNYTFKVSLGLYKKENTLKDLALFQDLETGKSIMVSK